MIKGFTYLLLLLLSTSCDVAIKKGVKIIKKETSKELFEEAFEKNTTHLSKALTKKIIKERITEVPRGKMSLRVLQNSDGSCTPELNNLGKQSGLFDDAFNSLLLKERRKAISPYNQFPTISQLASYDKKKLKLTEIPNAAILKQNMFIAMDKKSCDISRAFGGNAAHHVIEGSDISAQKSRELLKRFNININSPENGILLPENTESSIYKGAIHKTHHTKAYSDYVYNQIKNVKTRDEIIAKLIDIKHDLYSGKLNLQGPNQEINKNAIFK